MADHDRIYKTADDPPEYVREGDPRAAFLAFGPGDTVPKKVRDELGLDDDKDADEPGDEVDEKAEAKKAAEPANKSQQKFGTAK